MRERERQRERERESEIERERERERGRKREVERERERELESEKYQWPHRGARRSWRRARRGAGPRASRFLEICTFNTNSDGQTTSDIVPPN